MTAYHPEADISLGRLLERASGSQAARGFLAVGHQQARATAITKSSCSPTPWKALLPRSVMHRPRRSRDGAVSIFTPVIHRIERSSNQNAPHPVKPIRRISRGADRGETQQRAGTNRGCLAMSRYRPAPGVLRYNAGGGTSGRYGSGYDVATVKEELERIEPLPVGIL